ncbi:hypothetical protein ACLGIH_24745 [Streptomyces sp. HMX87]|uniref:hypothetical protein n=1 Tax=Streptomyces sp. HMX87 TaxID=3390849 RepID=UPI003A854809
MTTNPLTQEDPTVAAEYFEGRWHAKGRNLTTRDVAAANADLARKVERINNNRALSAEAKRIAIAREYRAARDQVAAAGQAVLDHVTSERARLSRKLFGHEGDADPNTVIVRRDAADRAAKLTDPHEAQRALDRAQVNGDVHLAQAIAAQAQAHMWTDVVSSYLAARPEAGETAQQLEALPDPNDGVWRMQHAMTYSVVQPQELGGIPDYQVDRLADTVLDGSDAA